MIKVGQKVICVVPVDGWYTYRKIWFMRFKYKSSGINPKYGKIYTCNDVSFNEPHQIWVCSVNEITGTYSVDCFKPAQEDFAESVCEKAIKEAKDEEISIIEETIKI